MKKYFAKRLLLTLIILLGVSIFIFIILQKQPGNPYLNSLNPNISQEQTEQILRQKGYYDSLPVKFIKWFKGVLVLDFGYSIQFKEPVIDLIMDRLPKTLMITIPSLLLSLTLSIPIGMYVTYKENHFISKVINWFSLIGISMPTFFFAILLIKWFSFDLNLFPFSGTGDITGNSSFLTTLYHGILPIMTLSIIQMSNFIRYIESYISHEVSQKYFEAAQGFGFTKWQTLLKFALPSILPQIVTLIFMEIPVLFSGALITETIFVWPGIGKLNYDAVAYRDYPLIMGLLIFTVFIILISNLIADLLANQLIRTNDVTKGGRS